MQILLANAKTMRKMEGQYPWTRPKFSDVADTLAAEMARMNTEDLKEILNCSHSIAVETSQYYREFAVAPKTPAIISYIGQAYKHLKAEDFTGEELQFVQNHLWITCFLYGLLRPMDGIAPYRMEHNVRLEACDDRPLNRFWRDKLTDVLIESVKADDGFLLHLSTSEYEQLFDWQRIKREINVVQPMFYTQKPDGSLKIQAVWAKTCRGAMLRFIVKEGITNPDDLAAFSYEGFHFSPTIGEAAFPCFIREY